MLQTPPPSPKSSGLPANPEDRIGQVIAGNIQLIGILGIGAYGTVYKAQDIQTNVQYAVKALNKVGLDPRQKRFQDREIQLHHAASQHPNVVSLVRILDSPDCTFVVIEYCPEGDLFSKITEEGHYIGHDLKAKQVFLQILSAVQHCHDNGIYHRDLKPENVLVRDDGWTVKLADFGLATRDFVTSDFGCGSTFYMSPECQQTNPKQYACYASAPNDVWSLGVILVNLTCGRNPWKRASMDDSTFRAFVRDRNFLRSILPISNELNAILQRIFDINPATRIELPELRDRILHCQRLTTHTPAATTPEQVLSPFYGPASKFDESTAAQRVQAPSLNLYESVPQLELPAQQYPPPVPGPVYYAPNSATVLLTPPSSGQCSPQLSSSAYSTYAKPSPAAAACYFPPVFGNLPDIRRCGQLFPNFNVPNHLWAVTH